MLINVIYQYIMYATIFVFFLAAILRFFSSFNMLKYLSLASWFAYFTRTMLIYNVHVQENIYLHT